MEDLQSTAGTIFMNSDLYRKENEVEIELLDEGAGLQKLKRRA